MGFEVVPQCLLELLNKALHVGHDEDPGAGVLLKLAADDLVDHQGLAESGGQGQEGAVGPTQAALIASAASRSDENGRYRNVCTSAASAAAMRSSASSSGARGLTTVNMSSRSP